MVYSLSLSLSLGVPVSEAAVIDLNDLNQVSGNEIVLTEDSSLLQSYLPTISKGETFAIKGKHTFTIGPSDASAMVDTYANATLQVEGSLSLIGNEAFGEALQKPLFPSQIEQNCSVRFFFTTSKNGVFFAIKIVQFYCADVCDLVTLWKSCLMVN